MNVPWLSPKPQQSVSMSSLDASVFCVPMVSIRLLGMEPWSLRNIWPVHLQRLRAIVLSILSCWHSSKRSWFEIIWGQKILTIFRRFLVWKDVILNRDTIIFPKGLVGLLQIQPCPMFLGAPQSLVWLQQPLKHNHYNSLPRCLSLRREAHAWFFQFHLLVHKQFAFFFYFLWFFHAYLPLGGRWNHVFSKQDC